MQINVNVWCYNFIGLGFFSTQSITNYEWRVCTWKTHACIKYNSLYFFHKYRSHKKRISVLFFYNIMQLFSLSVCVCLSLRFLRCSPFDEYKLWKDQVDNGSRRGRERLNLLTRSLLLRRTKDQLDSTGKPLVGWNTHLGLLQEQQMWILALNGGLPWLVNKLRIWSDRTLCKLRPLLILAELNHWIPGVSAWSDLRGASTQAVPGWAGCIRRGLCPIQVTQ